MIMLTTTSRTNNVDSWQLDFYYVTIGLLLWNMGPGDLAALSYKNNLWFWSVFFLVYGGDLKP